jgi:Flp pilus assembly protein TadB
MTALTTGWVVVILGLGWRWRPPPGRLAALRTTSAPPAGATSGLAAGRAAALGPGRSGRGRRRRRVAAVAAYVVIAVVLALAWPPLTALAAAAWFGRRRWVRARAVRRRQHAIAVALPDVIDLLVVAIGAGLTPTLAVRHLATLAPAPFAAAFADVDRRVERGRRLADGLDALPEHLGVAVHPLIAAIGGAERYGAPLAPALELLAHDARRERRRRAEEAARTLPVKLCFPLVCCVLPAFVLLTIAPLVAGAVRAVHV